jgi:hypothetical protein
VTAPLLRLTSTYPINDVVWTIQHVRSIKSFSGITSGPNLWRESWSQKKNHVWISVPLIVMCDLLMCSFTMKTAVQLDHIYEQRGGSLSRLTHLPIWRMSYMRVWKLSLLNRRGITCQVNPKKMRTGESAALAAVWVTQHPNIFWEVISRSRTSSSIMNWWKWCQHSVASYPDLRKLHQLWTTLFMR